MPDSQSYSTTVESGHGIHVWQACSVCFVAMQCLLPCNKCQVESMQTILKRSRLSLVLTDPQMLLIPCDQQHPGLEGCEYGEH